VNVNITLVGRRAAGRVCVEVQGKGGAHSGALLDDHWCFHLHRCTRFSAHLVDGG